MDVMINNTCYRPGFHVMAFDGDKMGAVQRELELDMRLKNRGTGDPEGPPDPEPGDRYIVIGAGIGLVAGGILGGFIGNLWNGFVGGVIGLIVGVIAGGIAGTRIGNSIKKRRRSGPGGFGPLSGSV